MIKKSILSKERTRILKGIVTGGIVGGVFGALAGFLYKTNILTIPGMGHIFKGSLIDVIITGILLGIFIGAVITGFIELCITRSEALGNDSDLNNSKLQLREEQLDISKNQVKTGKVIVHKEVISEEKNIVVPVTREELVIEKKVLNKKASDKINKPTETIRIPISEEHIEVIKHPEIKENVAIYKRKLQDTERVEETLKKEKIHIETTGDPEIINKET